MSHQNDAKTPQVTCLSVAVVLSGGEHLGSSVGQSVTGGG